MKIGCRDIGSRTYTSSGKACLTNTIPADPGQKYQVSIWAKTNKSATVELAFSPRHDDTALKLPRKIIERAVEPGQWQKVEGEFMLPDSGEYARCNFLFVTVGIKEADTIAEFDDLEMDVAR